MDKLALEEAGLLNVVSVPDGAPRQVKEGELPPQVRSDQSGVPSSCCWQGIVSLQPAWPRQVRPAPSLPGRCALAAVNPSPAPVLQHVRACYTADPHLNSSVSCRRRCSA